MIVAIMLRHQTENERNKNKAECSFLFGRQDENLATERVWTVRFAFIGTGVRPEAIVLSNPQERMLAHSVMGERRMGAFLVAESPLRLSSDDCLFRNRARAPARDRSEGGSDFDHEHEHD